MISRLSKQPVALRDRSASSATGLAGYPAPRPDLCFVVAILVAVAAGAASAWIWSGDFALPVVSTLLLVLAVPAALIASRYGRVGRSARSHVTYWDVAGALTFVGVCAGAMIEPDQMVRVIEATGSRP